MDSRCGCLVKLCGLTVIHTPLLTHTTPASAYVLCGWPPTSSSAVGKVQIKQLAASSHREAVGNRRPPCSCLFKAFQAASKDRHWHNYRHFALFRMKGMLTHVHSWLCATVAVNSICAREQCTCKTCIRSQYCLTSSCCMTDSITSIGVWSPLLGLLSYLFPFRKVVHVLEQQT